MRRSHFIILFTCVCLLICVLAACIGKDAQEQPPHVSESVQFQSGQDSPTAAPQPGMMRADHVQYITADGGYFRPNEYVTRGQLAQILCRLLAEDAPAPESSESFKDVPADSQIYADVERLAALGVVNGYGDGTFRPDEAVTRSEMVSLLCRLTEKSEVIALAFQDVPAEHWAMGSVAAAMASGWLSGYQDGGFYPDAPLTRAEAVVLLNRARGRTPNRTAIDVACASSPYQDVPQDFWAYYDIMDVAFSNEMLAYIMGEAEGAAQGMILLNDHLCHINAELRLDYFQKGFHTIQDGLATDGLYYAPEDGYFLQRSQPGLQEMDGSMFYVLSADGPFVTDYDLGYLHFGDNGRYTSGDAEVDGYVDAIMSGIIQGNTANLLREDKLRQAYNVLLYGDYDYMTRPVGWTRGSTTWSLECAKTMYETKKGSCYFWAAGFLYLARRLGFQAYPVCGGVNENNALHAWVMIDHGDIDDNDVNTEQSKNELTRVIDPDEYIYDIELDWAYRTGAHGRVPIRPGRDLFKQTRGQAVCIYIFPGDTWIAPPMDDTDALGNSTNGDDGEGGDGLFDDPHGGTMVEGVDYTTSYTNNGDGTITVTITYLTGDQAGTSTSYTIFDPDYDPTAPSTEPASPTTGPAAPTTGPAAPTTGPAVPTTGPAVPTTGPAVPTTGPVVPSTDPNTGTTGDPNTGTTGDPNTGTTGDPNTGTTGDPNAGTTGDPNAGTTGDPNTGTTTDPNTGTAGDPNAGVVTDPGAGTADAAVSSGTAAVTNDVPGSGAPESEPAPVQPAA